MITSQFYTLLYCSTFRDKLAVSLEILLERGKVSPSTQQILRTSVVPSVNRDYLTPKKEFLLAESTLKLLSDYWGTGDGKVSYPAEMVKMTANDDLLHLSPAKGSRLALEAFGAVVWCPLYTPFTL